MPTHESREPLPAQKIKTGNAPATATALFGRLLGAVGLVLAASSPLTYILAGMGPQVVLKLFAAFLLCGIYLLTNRDFFARMGRGHRGGLFALSGSTVALVLALVAGINVLALTHPKDFDFTREGIYTLSPQTLTVLHKLDTPVTILAFFGSQEPAYPAVDEALARYSRQSARLDVQMVDPQARPDLVKKYSITERGPRVVITAQGIDARAKNLSEEELTNGIIQAVAQSHKTVHFLVGHGEGDIQNEREPEGFALFARAIEADGYQVKTLNLQLGAPDAGTDAHLPHGSAAQHLEAQDAKPLEVPKDVDVLVVLAPTHKLLAPEVAAIGSYLQNGGRLLAFEEAQSVSGLAELLADWHVQVRDDLIVDTSPVGRLLGLGVASPILRPLEDGHPMTRGVTSVIMTTARSLTATQTGLPNIMAVPLVQTGESAWGETQLAAGGTISRDENDHPPPLYTAMAAYSSAADDQQAPRGRVVAMGDSDLVSNRLFALQSNEDLALNAVGWLAEEADKITIRPKTRAMSQLALTGGQMAMLKFLSMDIIPVLLVALGLGIVLVRRQR